jgi:hypothetical protein
VFGDFANQSGGILAHHQIHVLEAGEDLRENLGLHHHLGQVDRVLGDLRERAAHLALQLDAQSEFRCPQSEINNERSVARYKFEHTSKRCACFMETTQMKEIANYLGVWVLNERGQVGNGAGIDNSVGQLKWQRGSMNIE